MAGEMSRKRLPKWRWPGRCLGRHCQNGDGRGDVSEVAAKMAMRSGLSMPLRRNSRCTSRQWPRAGSWPLARISHTLFEDPNRLMRRDMSLGIPIPSRHLRGIGIPRYIGAPQAQDTLHLPPVAEAAALASSPHFSHTLLRPAPSVAT